MNESSINMDTVSLGYSAVLGYRSCIYLDNLGKHERLGRRNSLPRSGRESEDLRKSRGALDLE